MGRLFGLTSVNSLLINYLREFQPDQFGRLTPLDPVS